jgi:hypothetical protein
VLEANPDVDAEVVAVVHEDALERGPEGRGAGRRQRAGTVVALGILVDAGPVLESSFSSSPLISAPSQGESADDHFECKIL